jgi:hypothetical protein
MPFLQPKSRIRKVRDGLLEARERRTRETKMEGSGILVWTLELGFYRTLAERPNLFRNERMI